MCITRLLLSYQPTSLYPSPHPALFNLDQIIIIIIPIVDAHQTLKEPFFREKRTFSRERYTEIDERQIHLEILHILSPFILNAFSSGTPPLILPLLFSPFIILFSFYFRAEKRKTEGERERWYNFLYIAAEAVERRKQKTVWRRGVEMI